MKSTKNWNLINARKRKNLTQEELAKKTNVTKAAVSNWENGYSRPRLDVALIVADILEESISYLFSYGVQETHTKSVCTSVSR